MLFVNFEGYSLKKLLIREFTKRNLDSHDKGASHISRKIPKTTQVITIIPVENILDSSIEMDFMCLGDWNFRSRRHIKERIPGRWRNIVGIFGVIRLSGYELSVDFQVIMQ